MEGHLFDTHNVLKWQDAGVPYPLPDGEKLDDGEKYIELFHLENGRCCTV